MRPEVIDVHGKARFIDAVLDTVAVRQVELAIAEALVRALQPLRLAGNADLRVGLQQEQKAIGLGPLFPANASRPLRAFLLSLTV
jgi:hypothetical protein